jgi:hypothetical protein
MQSQLDLNLEMVVATLLRDELIAARMILSQMRGAGQKREALNILAKNLLIGEDAELFSESISLLEKTAKARNALAHGLIGSDPNFPDALVVMEPRGEFVTALTNTSITGETDELPEAMVRNARLWTEVDFARGDREAVKARAALVQLQVLIRLVRIDPGDPQSPLAEQMRSRLRQKIESGA